MNEPNELVSDLRAFRDERNWLKFHSPKSLSMALAAEVGELLAEMSLLNLAVAAPMAAVMERMRALARSGTIARLEGVLEAKRCREL